MAPPRRRRQAEYEDGDEEADVSTQRNRRANDDDSADEREEDETMDVDHRPGGGLEDQLATKLVRYALSCEFSRTPIRRQAIRDKGFHVVLGEHPRLFRKVFDIAQKQLRAVFGMEMSQLPVREKLTLEEKRKAISSNSQVKSAETWILVSTLPRRFQAPLIIAPSKAPTAEVEATYVGFYTMVIALILLNGGEVTEQKLKRYLSRVNADNKLGAEKTEDVLARMEKMGYVAKRVENISADQDKNISWLVGPRGKQEVGPEGVAGMIREVFGGSNPGLEKQLAASLGVKAPEEEREEEERDGENGEENGQENSLVTDDEPRRSRRVTRSRYEDDGD
ncbi:hypothetical protein jhhlp_001422 [Lomentospora prolificans]|uniref:MAGE domain-containing protein n=1 Tax=Lomentospora prolificans TaxID=41688 RepID=A0A2N3NI72_9PEZI|nr:hypothetical protein jhhlp_001422 [Lomentospora prolificans]